MKNEGLGVSHLVSIGGWNSPHPDTRLTAADWFDVWRNWNNNLVARTSEVPVIQVEISPHKINNFANLVKRIFVCMCVFVLNK